MEETDRKTVKLTEKLFVKPSNEASCKCRMYSMSDKKRERLENVSNIEHFKETTLHWKNCHEYKMVYTLIANTKKYLQSEWLRGVQYWLYLYCFQYLYSLT